MKKTTIIIFLIVVAAQWAVPVSMIRTKEAAIKNGKTFCFKAMPFDPYDPFRGKYIYLNLEARSYVLKRGEELIQSENAYAIIKENKEGFAEVASVSGIKPETTSDYVKVKFEDGYVKHQGDYAYFDFPFDKFFMEEEKAPTAENLYRTSSRDTSEVTCAVVHVWKGEGVVTDVTINNKSIVEIIRERKGN